jgi:hypothetical protein
MDLDIDTARLRPALRTRVRRAPLRACTVCGTPTTGSRCPKHQLLLRGRDNPDYQREHKATRQALEPLVATGTITCPRCNQPILPGQPWDLDHNDDRTSYRGPAHQACNRGKRQPKGGVTTHPLTTRHSAEPDARKSVRAQ